jgi:hypothetical protein
VCVVIIIAMVWGSFVVKEFWVLGDNITTMVMLLREPYYNAAQLL